MNKEAQRIAIAESVGIHLHDGDHAPSNYMFVTDLPDYLNDLNAMHEVEKILSDNNRMKFRGELVEMMRPKYGFESACLLAIHATAAQRAEAYIRTIGKWEGTTV